MVWIDDLMREKPDENPYSYKDANKRPHQLFLGGDQIYADDVGKCHMHMLIDLSKRLIGTTDHPEALEDVEARELLPVGSIRKKQIDPPTKLEDYGKALKAGEADAKEFRLPADHAWFPAGRRYLQSIVDAQMTSIDGTSHLFAFGEFAAMYLSVWSNAVWTPLRDPREPELLDLPTMEEVFERAKWPNIISTFVGTPLNVEETRDTLLQGETSEIKKKNKELKLSPFRDEGYVGYERKDNGKYTDDKGKPQTAQEHFAKKLDERKTDLRKERRRLTLFHDGLAKVRRVLANIPTYMMFDDHDFTDDWNLNPMWYDRVYTTDLGVTSARNALASYAVFQDWGNDPDPLREAGRLQGAAREDRPAVSDRRAGAGCRGGESSRCALRLQRTGRVGSGHGQVPGPQSSHQVALLRAGAEAPRRRDRQSYAPQFPVAPRSAGQRRGQFRSERSHCADGADSCWALHGRQGSAARDSAAPGARRAAAR